MGPKIAKLKKERHITDDELAQLVGVSKETITLWEAGFSTPNKSQIKKLATVFQVMPDELCQDNYSGERTVNNSGFRTVNNSNFRTVNNSQIANEQAAKVVKVFVIFMIISVFSSVISFIFSFQEEREDIERAIREINIDATEHNDDEILEKHIICKFGEEEKEISIMYYESDEAIITAHGDYDLLEDDDLYSYVDAQDAVNHILSYAHTNDGICRINNSTFDGEMENLIPYGE